MVGEIVNNSLILQTENKTNKLFSNPGSEIPLPGMPEGMTARIEIKG